MALNKVKLGDLIERVYRENVLNKFSINDVRGINNKKELIKTKADVSDRDFSRFSIVLPNEFVFNHRTSRNGGKFSISYNYENNPIIVTEDYVVFKIKDLNRIMVEWLYMFFNRSEFDRFVITNSWGSSTEFYNWEDICDVEINLPDLATQRKFVKLYLSLLENQKPYKCGLEDLKFACDAYIEDLRKKVTAEKIGKYILCTDRKTNNPSLPIKGISNQRKLADSNSRVEGVETDRYLRIDPNEFGYSPIHINDGSIAFNDTNESYLLSPIYKTFKVIDENKLNSQYLMMWLSRDEFTRYCWFYAFGSARDTFEWNQLCDVEIPIPSIEVQRSIVGIFLVYKTRKQINEQLKELLKNICPILIKGSIEEAR
ncbi:MAG: restriction endonuclease subunit S [Bacilli bacterium]